MTDYRDPGNRDPDQRYANPRDPARRDMRAANTMWGWIAGAVFLALVLAVIFGWSGSGDRTAENTATSPPATTGSATPMNSPARPAAPAKPAPANNAAPAR